MQSTFLFPALRRPAVALMLAGGLLVALGAGHRVAGPAAAQPPPPPATVPVVRQGGSTSEVVRTIQYLLRHHGAEIAVDGDFGPQTEAAVRAFQQARRLTVDGVVGPQTWGTLFVTVQQGSQGDAVRAVQSQLQWRGMEIVVDGAFGPQTDGAVREFQRFHYYLVRDGAVGPQTWTALVGEGRGILPDPGFVYRVTGAAGSTDVLAVRPDRSVAVQASDDRGAQAWLLEDGPDGYNFVRHEGTGLYLENDPALGAFDVRVREGDGGEAQQWKLEPTANNVQMILRNRATGRVLDRGIVANPANPGGVRTGTIGENAGSAVRSVQWTFTYIRPDLFTFMMAPTGMFLGMEEQYLVTVRNNGTAAVRDVILTVTFPPAVAAESIEFTNRGFACAITTPQLVTCTGGNMAAGGEQGIVRINVRGVALTTGGEQVVAIANPDRTIAEPNYDDNTDREPVRVIVPR